MTETKKKRERKRRKKNGGKAPLVFLQRTWRGFCHYAAEMGRIAAVEIPFCAGGTIYNSVIDLFMCLHRLSLDATGHVWEANRLHGSFPDFPGDFFPTAFWVYGVQTDAPRSAFFKKKERKKKEKERNRIRLIKRAIGARFFSGGHSDARSAGWQEERFNFSTDLTSSCRQQQQHQRQKQKQKQISSQLYPSERSSAEVKLREWTWITSRL